MLVDSRILVVVGTRPEFIKMAPVVTALRAAGCRNVVLCATGQHREMTSGLLDAFGLAPNIELDSMVPGQSLSELSARLMTKLDGLIRAQQPDLILAQGDTTSTLITALSAFHQHVPFGHVEAGLRTFDLGAPWPEEANRQLVSRVAALHFSPTNRSRNNLLREHVPSKAVFVTGNTVVDAVLHVRAYLRDHPVDVPGLPRDWRIRWHGRQIVLMTGHRRENFRGGLDAVFKAVVEVAKNFRKTIFIYPVHMNPNVRAAVDLTLRTASMQLSNVVLIEPLAYLPFVTMMDAATVLLTDSGGLQEEGPSLGKPVLVTRSVTERPEVVEAGAAILVGTDTSRIVGQLTSLLSDPERREAMRVDRNPIGDGRAAERIAAVCVAVLNGTDPLASLALHERSTRSAAGD